MDGNFTTEDVEDVPAMAYVFKSITSLLNVDNLEHQSIQRISKGNM